MTYGQDRKGRFWTINELAYVNDRKGIPAIRIAEALGRTKHAVRHVRNKQNGLTVRSMSPERLQYLETAPIVHFCGNDGDGHSVEFAIMEFPQPHVGCQLPNETYKIFSGDILPDDNRRVFIYHRGVGYLLPGWEKGWFDKEQNCWFAPMVGRIERNEMERWFEIPE